MEISQITTSYSRKLNHAVYGGEQYESSDHFVSLTADVEADENIIEAHDQLTTVCRELVNASVGKEVLKMQGGVAWPKFIETLRQIRLGNHQLTDAEHVSWTELQRSIYEEFKKLQRGKPELKPKPDVDIKKAARAVTNNPHN